MQYVAIVALVSSAQMYIDDIVRIGYRPLVLLPTVDPKAEPEVAANAEFVKKTVVDKAEFMEIDGNNIMKSIDAIKKYDIVAVLPGTDKGVRAADILNKELGLRGNNPETTYMRCTKKGMDEALRKARIRHILTREIESEEDIVQFWKEEDLKKAVLKFSEYFATLGLKICDTLEECIAHFAKMNEMAKKVGLANGSILMQEYIGGTEYIVNSISIDGVHKITDIWRYEKVVQEGGVLAYDYCVLVDELSLGMNAIIQYDYDVLDAVHMDNGISHNEIKVDHKGPVLIEVNPRPMGANLTSEYLDEIFGCHMTDLVLKSYLQNGFFNSLMMSPYAPHKSAMMKLSIVPKKVRGNLEPFFEMVRNLNSFREITYFSNEYNRVFPRTVDLETSPFFIKMTNKDYGELMRDYELLRNIEKMYFGMIFSKNEKIPGCPMHSNIDSIVKMIPYTDRYAIVYDDKTEIVDHGAVKVSGESTVFDGIVIAMNKESDVITRFKHIFTYMNMVRRDGVVIILPESYRGLPYGAAYAEVMLAIKGFKMEILPSKYKGILVGHKK